jgi:methanogenic corrinoid protein MtbC1
MDNAGQLGLNGWRPGEAEDTQAQQGRWSSETCEVVEDRLAWLARAIEAEIIPRLMLAHKTVPEAPEQQAVLSPTPSADEVIEFTRLVLTQDGPAVSAYVEMLRERGASLESLYLDLLAPTARRLGELWNADLCDFTQVTIGTGQLQQVLRELTRVFPTDIKCVRQGRKAVFAPTLGEQHTLGLVMVAEFFIRAGWDVCADYPASANGLNSLVRNQHFDLIGLSVGSEAHLDLLAADVRATRRASCNRAIVVMVGGPIFVEHPELVARVGADATAVDGRQALAKAEILLNLRADRPGNQSGNRGILS